MSAMSLDNSSDDEVHLSPPAIPRIAGWRDVDGDADTIPPPAAAAAAASSPSSSPPPPMTSLSRTDLLFDLRLSFADAFANWMSKQGAEALLTDATYATIVRVLQQDDKAHAKHRQWKERYELVNSATGPTLFVSVDAAHQAKPRGLSVKRKRDAGEVAPLAAAAASSSSSVASSPSSQSKKPIIVKKMVARAGLVEDAIRVAHEGGVGGTGHGGIAPTLKRVNQLWHGISRPLVVAFIRRCLRCAQTQPNKSSKYEIRAIHSDEFLGRVQMDLFSLKFADVKRTVMHLQDHFTKFSVLRCIPTKGGVEVAAVLLEFFSMFGSVKLLQSDNGGEFKNEHVKALCEAWNVKQLHGAPYHPQTQGSVESGNRVAKDKLRSYIADHPTDPWEKCVAMTQWHMNTFWHRSTKYSPFRLVFGREPNLHTVSTQIIEEVEESKEEQEEGEFDEPSQEQYDEDAERLQASIDHGHEAALANSEEYRLSFVASANAASVSLPQFAVGDLVTLKLRNPRNNQGIPAASLALPRILCVVLHHGHDGKYVLFTGDAIIKERIATNDIQPAAEILRPAKLNVPAAELYAQHREAFAYGAKSMKGRITLADLMASLQAPKPLVIVTEHDATRTTVKIRKTVIHKQ